MTTTLEGLVVTRDGRHQFDQLIRQLRAACDRVAVLIDEDGDNVQDTRRRASAAGVDDVYVAPVGGWIERVLPPFYDSVRCDWAIRLDDDELLSDRLATFLATLRASETQDADYYRLARAWCVDAEAREYLYGREWWPDVQLRLFRRGHCFHGGVVHEGPIGIGRPGLRVNDPIIHLNPLKPRREREETVQRYHAIDSNARQGDMQVFERYDAPTRPFPWRIWQPAACERCQAGEGKR